MRICGTAGLEKAILMGRGRRFSDGRRLAWRLIERNWPVGFCYKLLKFNDLSKTDTWKKRPLRAGNG
jgi:hypothetical protein